MQHERFLVPPRFACAPTLNRRHANINLSLSSGPNIRIREVCEYPSSFQYLFTQYGPRPEDEDDGQGPCIITMDLSNSYRFPGLWNVCGYVGAH